MADIAHALRLWTAALQHLSDAQRDEGATYLRHIASAYHTRYHATVASGLLTRYQHQDKLTDLQQALALYRETLAGLPQGRVDRDNLLMQFGLALTLAYERRGEVG